MAKVGKYYKPNLNNAESADEVLLLVTRSCAGRVEARNVKDGSYVVIDRSDFGYYYEPTDDGQQQEQTS